MLPRKLVSMYYRIVVRSTDSMPNDLSINATQLGAAFLPINRATSVLELECCKYYWCNL